MKVLFISDNFPPEVNAPATRTYEHCREWVKDGIEVTVITCFPNFPDGVLFKGYSQKLFSVENTDGIRVIRVFTYMTANKGFIRRTIDYISFGIAAFVAGLFISTDVIIGTSPQFFSAVWARRLAFVKRKPWIMEVRDLWPESIKSVGAVKSGFMLKYFEWLEFRLYESAARIITVTDTFKWRIANRGILPDKIHVIKNGVNYDLFFPREKDKALLDKYSLHNKFIVGFIGTLGMAHKLDIIIKIAGNFNAEGIHFLIVGAGSEKESLIKLTERLAPPNVTIEGMVSKNDVPRYISIVDVALINLRKSDTFKTVIPSKIFESSAMGKPILLGVDGEARLIVEKYNAGLFFEPEDVDDFSEKLIQIKKDDNLRHELVRGAAMLAKDFDRKVLAGMMRDVITGVKHEK